MCNIFGFDCDGCENYLGACGWSDGGCEKVVGTLVYNKNGVQTCFSIHRDGNNDVTSNTLRSSSVYE